MKLELDQTWVERVRGDAELTKQEANSILFIGQQIADRSEDGSLLMPLFAFQVEALRRNGCHVNLVNEVGSVHRVSVDHLKGQADVLSRLRTRDRERKAAARKNRRLGGDEPAAEARPRGRVGTSQDSRRPPTTPSVKKIVSKQKAQRKPRPAAPAKRVGSASRCSSSTSSRRNRPRRGSRFPTIRPEHLRGDGPRRLYQQLVSRGMLQRGRAALVWLVSAVEHCIREARDGCRLLAWALRNRDRFKITGRDEDSASARIRAWDRGQEAPEPRRDRQRGGVVLGQQRGGWRPHVDPGRVAPAHAGGAFRDLVAAFVAKKQAACAGAGA